MTALDLSFLQNAAALAATISFIWWRLGRIEKRLDDIERRITELSERDAHLAERVSRLEGWRNGMSNVRR